MISTDEYYMIKPNFEDIMQFISQTHQVENIQEVTYETVSETLNKKKQNAYAHGHIMAILYATSKVLDTNDYPCRGDLNTLHDLESNIGWLKSINSYAFSPLIKTCDYQMTKIGDWRTDIAGNLLTNAPSPFLIPVIMFSWLKKLKKLHEIAKPNLSNPYGLTQEQYKEMREFADEQPYFFSTVQPFSYANNRFGRLMQNIIRIGWNMPIVYNVGDRYEQFKVNLDEYQRTTLISIIKEANNLRFKI